jgi:acetyl-CoA C-acetyltransferase
MRSRADVAIVSPLRTPIGKFGGLLAGVSAVDLGAAAARAVLERTRFPVERLDQVVFGQARQAGSGPNPARQIGRRAGLPDRVPAWTVNQACGSGIRAIVSAHHAVAVGEAGAVLAGGTESMSRVPYLLDRLRFGQRMGHVEVQDGMYRDGFACPLCGLLMGETAEVLAERHGIGREEQDRYAAESQRRCEAARREGRFQAEIAPVEVSEGKGTRRCDQDEHPRDGVTAASLAKLPPVFRAGGSVHAGNSSGITDGAAACLVLPAAEAGRLEAGPAARIVGFATAGVDPEVMGIGPVPAVRALLASTGVRLEEIDLIEMNEAFAAQVIACARELDLDLAKVNVNGGAIALGHPIGCTGTRIVTTLMHEMQRRPCRLGLATLCISGGMGMAILLERL